MSTRGGFLKQSGVALAGMGASLALRRVDTADANVTAPASATAGVQLGLRADGQGNLLKDGKVWRGIGVNWVGAFGRVLADPSDKAVKDGFAVLGQHNIPFIRFVGSGFYAKNMTLYQSDRREYYRRLDITVSQAEKHNVGLIVSLFFGGWALDMTGERGIAAWLDPDSKTNALMKTYIKEVIERYGKSPAIWGWEWGNELNLSCDLPNAAKMGHKPEDLRTHEAMRKLFIEFGREVRRYDPQRIIDSGNSIPRPSAWHQIKENSWTKDTPEQFAEVLMADAPDPMDVVSIHCYGDNFAPDRLPVAAAAARRMKKPLFVGEFGVPEARTPETEKTFREQLAMLEREQVPLAALWEFDVRPIPANRMKWLIAPNNDRFYMLAALQEHNARLAP